jgi:predicted DNA binding CopG/RHH family protein
MQDIMSFNQKETRQDIWANYDPKKAREGIRKSKGALKGVDRDTLQKEIQAQRGQDSKGRPA